MTWNIVEEAIRQFNNNDIDALAKCWHEDVTVYELLTNKLIVSGRAEFKELNRKETTDKKNFVIIENQMEVGNMVIIHKSYKDSDHQDVSICKIEDNLIKTVWFF